MDIFKINTQIYPIFLYIYKHNGTFEEPLQINSHVQLESINVKLLIRVAMSARKEIRIKDIADELLFHAKDGRVLFDGKMRPEDG